MKYRITFWFDAASKKTAEAEVRKILGRTTTFRRCGYFEIQSVSEQATVRAVIDVPELRHADPRFGGISQTFIEDHICPHFGNKFERLKFACLVVEPLVAVELLADCARPDNRKGL